jgi:hypothetical protein
MSDLEDLEEMIRSLRYLIEEDRYRTAENIERWRSRLRARPDKLEARTREEWDAFRHRTYDLERQIEATITILARARSIQTPAPFIEIVEPPDPAPEKEEDRG